MQLKDLLKYNDIVIQCHDNPDADALASGYALWWYLTKNGRRPSSYIEDETDTEE